MVVVVNPDFLPLLAEPLEKRGFAVVAVPHLSSVAPPLTGHPDLQFTIINNTLVHCPNIAKSFLEHSALSHISKVSGMHTPCDPYPNDIAYNVVHCGSHLLCYADKTDPVVLRHAYEDAIAPLAIKQGYARCSIAPVGTNAIITSDRKAATVAKEAGLSVLSIEHKQIDLPGYPYGFFGGATGFHNNTLYITGSLDSHSDKERIYHFCHKCGVDVVTLTSKPVFDAGSLFFV